jgi:hypothetical protein
MIHDEILAHLGLAGKDPNRNHLVRCPFHEDKTPSCSVHPGKGVFHCFSCGKKGTLDLLEAHGGSSQTPVAIQPLYMHVPPADVEETAHMFLRERNLLGIDGLYPDIDPASKTFGYLAICDHAGTPKAWRRLFPGNPRYLNAPGAKEAFCAQPPRVEAGSPVWLVEGQLDALALAKAGAQGGVYALGTCEMPEDLGFALQDHHVFLCMDNDVPGFRGAKRASYTLKELEVAHTRLRLQPHKDPGEAWATDPEALSKWVREKESAIAPDERGYVQRWLQGGIPMLVVPTGIVPFDNAFGGGYKPGLHVLQGMTSVGKSSWAIRAAYHAAQRGKKIIYVTTELTKHQLWARLASCLPGAPSWVRLEESPDVLPGDLHPVLADMAERIKVMGNRSVKQISNDVRAFQADLLVVDYLQRLRGAGIEGEGVSAASLGALTGELSDLSQGREMAILAVSSISRASYESGGGLGGAKGSGDVEFFSQSLCSMVRPPGGRDVTIRVEKNTRGEVGAQIPLPYFPLNCGFTMESA